MIAYPCLVLDHDDTVVRSTPELGYPSFCQTLARLRPDVHLTLNEFLLYCYEPGFHALCRDILHFSDEEMAEEGRVWNAYIRAHMPPFYAGMADLIRRYKAEEGVLCVVSHSYSETILRDYRTQCGVEPDCIFGWELSPEQRKPNAYPLMEIMRRYGFQPRELLVVDDLKPGYDMASLCGVPFACAGWSHELSPVASAMRACCSLYLEDVAALESLLFSA